MPRAIVAKFDVEGRLVPVEVRPSVRGRIVTVEVPQDIDELKLGDLELARSWRFETRKVFNRLLDRGYVIRGFSSGIVEGRRRSSYILERGFKVS
jgi:predicted GNAT superfamily acetyltransferase